MAGTGAKPPVSSWAPHNTHPHILTLKPGKEQRRLYRCSKCEYWNDRFSHTQMHYARIHKRQGRALPGKRKYSCPWAEESAARRRLEPPQAGPPAALAEFGAAPGEQAGMRVFTFGSYVFQDEGTGLVHSTHPQRAAAAAAGNDLCSPAKNWDEPAWDPLDAAGVGRCSAEKNWDEPGWDPLDAAGVGLCSAEKNSDEPEWDPLDAAGDDLCFLIPSFCLWKWEQFDVAEIYGQELELWLRAHNTNAARPCDAAHTRQRSRMRETMKATRVHFYPLCK